MHRACERPVRFARSQFHWHTYRPFIDQPNLFAVRRNTTKITPSAAYLSSSRRSVRMLKFAGTSKRLFIKRYKSDPEIADSGQTYPSKGGLGDRCKKTADASNTSHPTTPI